MIVLFMTFRKTAILIVALLSAVAAVIWYQTQADPTVLEPKEDTGMTREQTEKMMRTIGYVQ